jgi:hypothetical protein
MFFGAALSLAPADVDAGRPLADAARKTAGLSAYAFQMEEKPGPGTGGPVQGKYEKGKPVAFTADKIEFLRKGDALAYKDGGQWQRSKTGVQSDPLRILGAAAKVRGARLPHDELADLVKGLKDPKGSEAKEPKGATVYRGTLDEAVAKALAPTSRRSVAQGGSAEVWVGADGQVLKYSVKIRLQGRLGNAEVDGHLTRAVQLSDQGSARVEVPAEAQKALE